MSLPKNGYTNCNFYRLEIFNFESPATARPASSDFDWDFGTSIERMQLPLQYFVDVLENTIISFLKASRISMITFQNVLSAAYIETQ